IYQTYIKQGAAIEVNVPDDTKTQIGAMLGETPKRNRRSTYPLTIFFPHATCSTHMPTSFYLDNLIKLGVSAGRQTDESESAATESVAVAVPNSAAEVVDWFNVAFDEIVELIVRDSWGRFTASSLFNEFITLFNSERQLDKVHCYQRCDYGSCDVHPM